MKWEIILAVLLLGALLVAPSKGRAQTYEAFVVRVIDGDTIVVKAGNVTRRVRIADIDAPETGHRGLCPAEAELGAQATVRLRAMILNELVIVRVRKIDKYGRDFAYVMWWDVDVGKAMLNLGLAKPWPDHHPKPRFCP